MGPFVFDLIITNTGIGRNSLLSLVGTPPRVTLHCVSVDVPAATVEVGNVYSCTKVGMQMIKGRGGRIIVMYARGAQAPAENRRIIGQNNVGKKNH